MSENSISYRKNYDSKHPHYWSTYENLRRTSKRELEYLLQTGCLLTPDKKWKPGEGNYREFPDAPDFIVPVERVPLLHGKPIPVERIEPVHTEYGRNYGRVQGKKKRVSANRIRRAQ